MKSLFITTLAGDDKGGAVGGWSWRKRVLILTSIVVLLGGATVACLYAFTDILNPYNTLFGTGERVVDTGSRISREPTASGAELGVFAGYGQSNSDCCGSGPNPSSVEHSHKIFNFFTGANTTTFEYKEPMLGAFCHGSCPYLKIGNELIDAGMYDEVVFSTSGMPGAPLSMINGDEPAFPYFSYLVETYKGMLAKYGKVDGILFHQGESDNGKSDAYEALFDSFLQNLANEGIPVGGAGGAKIYVSRTTRCGYLEIDSALSAVQLALADKDGVEEGPNTDTVSIDKRYRYDSCHFTQEGWDEVADLWLEKLT